MGKVSDLEHDLDVVIHHNIELQGENLALKAQLFEARQAVLKEGMRADALQARIDGGIRMYAFSVGGVEAIELFSDPEKLNATLILDEGV